MVATWTPNNVNSTQWRRDSTTITAAWRLYVRKLLVGPKKLCGPTSLITHIFKKPEPICTTSGRLSRHVWPPTKIKRWKFKVTRSRNACKKTITRPRVVVTISNLAASFIAWGQTRDTLSRRVGQVDRKQKDGGLSASVKVSHFVPNTSFDSSNL